MICDQRKVRVTLTEKRREEAYKKRVKWHLKSERRIIMELIERWAISAGRLCSLFSASSSHQNSRVGSLCSSD